MPEVSQNISMQDLRAIIHGLKMAGFAGVDEDALEGIEFRIRSLPTPEQLANLGQTPKAIKGVVKEVGEIMKLIEQFGKGDREYKARFESKKKLPPRYKVLEWRKNMQAHQVVKELVKISAKADENGQLAISKRMITCAKKITDRSIEMKDLEEAIIDLKTAGYNEEARFMREAALSDWWAGMKGGMQGAWQGAKNLGHMVADPFKMNQAFQKTQKFLANSYSSLTELVNALKEMEGFVYNPQMKQVITEVRSNVEGINTNVNTISTTLKEKVKPMMDAAQKQTTVPVAGQPQANPEAAASAGAGAPAETPAETPAPDVAAPAPSADLSKVDYNALWAEINRRNALKRKNVSQKKETTTQPASQPAKIGFQPS